MAKHHPIIMVHFFHSNVNRFFAKSDVCNAMPAIQIIVKYNKYTYFYALQTDLFAKND